VRSIAKGAEPPSLTAHRLTPHSGYDNYADKDALRYALVTEQRGLCCYCMGRIKNGPDTMKIEHWRSQSRHSAEQLNYRNLLGACMGGHRQPPGLQHCDTRKGDRDLRWNPADPAHHIDTRIRYELDGSIRSNDPDFDAELDEVLNLNLVLLRNNRKAVWIAVIEWWQHDVRGRNEERRRLERERDRRTGGTDELEPFCQVAFWWVEQRLARMPA
jgi:uncharacterized protein (TIGR02646 family)